MTKLKTSAPGNEHSKVLKEITPSGSRDWGDKMACCEQGQAWEGNMGAKLGGSLKPGCLSPLGLQ